ncbi:MAG: hypothetical protein ACRDRO_02755 [Pseudonocardiaceae bacterium]
MTAAEAADGVSDDGADEPDDPDGDDVEPAGADVDRGGAGRMVSPGTGIPKSSARIRPPTAR